MQPFESSTTTATNWQTCTCGRKFDQLNAFSNHKQTCMKSKKCLSSALAKAKEKWTGSSTKCQKVQVELTEPRSSVDFAWLVLSLWGQESRCAILQVFVVLIISLYSPNQPEVQILAENPPEADNTFNSSMMEQRLWTLQHNRWLPMHYQDVVPQPLPPLPLACTAIGHHNTSRNESDNVVPVSSVTFSTSIGSAPT